MSATETLPGSGELLTSSYRAAVVHDFAEPLPIDQVRRRVADPRAGPRAGRGVRPLPHRHPRRPRRLAGQAVAAVRPRATRASGSSSELGPGVTEVAVGDRVAMPWLGYACGTCDYCVSGWETLCLEQKNMGYSIDGGFGEYAVAYARYVVEVPDGIDPFDAAPLTCAGVTTYKAVKVAGTRSSDLVAVFGVGGLGHLAIQYARDRRRTGRRGRPHRREARARARARRRVHGQRGEGGSGRGDPASSAAPTRRSRWRSRRARSSRRTRSLRRGGTLVFVALPADNEVTLPIFETVLNGITIVGSIVGTRTDLREVFELHAAGRTHVIREIRPLDEVNEAIADVEAGRVAARVVFRP